MRKLHFHIGKKNSRKLLSKLLFRLSSFFACRRENTEDIKVNGHASKVVSRKFSWRLKCFYCDEDRCMHDLRIQVALMQSTRYMHIFVLYLHTTQLYLFIFIRASNG